MEGFIDHVSPDRKSIIGWIKNPNNIEPSLTIQYMNDNFGTYGGHTSKTDSIT